MQAKFTHENNLQLFSQYVAMKLHLQATIHWV